MTAPCPVCRRPRGGPGRYLCPVCWRLLPAPARKALARRDGHAHARLRQLHDQLDARIPLAEITVAP